MSTAAVIGAPPAPVGRRVVAALIDGLGTALCALPIWLAVLTTGVDAERAATAPVLPVLPSLIGGGLLLVWGVVQWVLHGTKGWTIGRRLLGLRVVDVMTGRPIGLGRALVRTLIVALGTVACGVGQWVVLASVFWDPTGRRRGWHDRIAEAVVVDVRATSAGSRLDGYRERDPRAGGRSGATPTAASSLAASAAGGAASERPSDVTAGPSSSTIPVPPSEAAAGRLPGVTPVAPSRPDAPQAPGQTRWAGMIANGQPPRGPGLVLPPLGGSRAAADEQPPLPPTTPSAGRPAIGAPLLPVPGPGLGDTQGLAVGEALSAQDDAAGPAAGTTRETDPDAMRWTGTPAAVPEDGPQAGVAAPETPLPGNAMGDTTQLPPVPGEPAAAPVVPPMDSFWSDPAPTHDTSTPPGPARSAAGTPRPGGIAPGPAGWAARLPDGTLLDLDGGPVLIGRNPAGLVGLRAVAVHDPGMSVSKTHLVIGADVAGAWVMDRGSTNGTLVTLPDGERIVCLPDQRVRVAPGSVVFFGDLSLTVGLLDPDA
ncbi:RDD family protein [Cellulomonas sp. RIT-PI-Y]|uniref:RDD family protein n=1 Tax=Cellulomonas sp. RIT-PI-Y TaxID=3035297 RepID=UPI0021D95A7E|nr:RDD family protein [Cellulomonas sp. RIT-PI-Y]